MEIGGKNGIVDRPSLHTVEETVARLEEALRAKGVTLFAVVDHSGEALKIGMPMPPTKLLVFGNPRAGTPVMLASPRSALDLPLKILVWQDTAGTVWASYNSPDYLRERHGLTADQTKVLAAVEAFVAAATGT